MLAGVLTKLGALVAVDEHNTKAKILDSLNIHSNILQAPIQGSIELSKPEILNLQVDDATKLKGHKLSPNTIRNSVPAFSLQCYSNPCLYWLAKPAFIILAAKVLTNTSITLGSLINKYSFCGILIKIFLNLQILCNEKCKTFENCS